MDAEFSLILFPPVLYSIALIPRRTKTETLKIPLNHSNTFGITQGRFTASIHDSSSKIRWEVELILSACVLYLDPLSSPSQTPTHNDSLLLFSFHRRETTYLAGAIYIGDSWRYFLPGNNNNNEYHYHSYRCSTSTESVSGVVGRKCTPLRRAAITFWITYISDFKQISFLYSWHGLHKRSVAIRVNQTRG